MAEIKKLQTRIALKHDTWANWHDETKENQGANLVLLKGEIGFCEIPSGNAEATTAPTVLFKVGDGTTPFKTLKWASALAADVYGWAKASDVVLEGKSIKFVTGTGENRVVVKEIPIPYMTEDDVKAITNPIATDVSTLKSDVAALQAKFTGDNSVQGQIDALDGRLDVIEGEAEGSVKKALADAKAYTDEREVIIKAYADQAEADAKAYTDAREAEINKTTAALSAKDSELAGLISDNTTAIGTVSGNLAQELLDRAAADKAITDSIGAVTEGKTVVGMISDAQTAATSAAKTYTDNQIGALARGTIQQHASLISANTEAISALDGLVSTNKKNIAKEVEDRAAADALINEKFGAEYSKDSTIASAIADAKKAGTDAGAAVDALSKGAVATNASEISRVEDKFDDYVEAQAELGHESRIAAMEAFFEGASRDEGEGENLKNALDTLKEIQDFATGEGTAAAEMLGAIDANAKAIKAVEDIVKDGGTLEVRVDAAEAAVTANAGAIEALQELNAGFEDGKTVKEVINAVSERAEKGITDAKAADDKAVQAQNEVDALEGVVGTLRSEYDVTKQAAIDNAADITNLQAEFSDGGRVTALEADSHTHSFVETELNKIADGDVAKWNEAYSKRHEHSFVESELNKIADGDVAKWNAAVTTANGAAADTADLKPRMQTAESEIDTLQDASHTHGNKDELDLIVSGDKAKWDDAYAKRHVHANSAELDLIASGDKAKWDAAATQADTNKSDIAAIKGDYLKMADLFIIDCGTSTTVIHEEAKA